MRSEVVHHAWSVLCDRAFIDRDTNNVSVDAIEQLTYPLPEIPVGAKGVLLPYRIELISLWYRQGAEKPSKHRARVRLEDPEGRDIGLSMMEVDLSATTRYRTRAQMPAIPVTGPGLYYFVVEQETADTWKEVARVPLEIANRNESLPINAMPKRLAEASPHYGGARRPPSKKRRLTKK